MFGLSQLEVYADLCEIENRPFDVWPHFEDWLVLAWGEGDPIGGNEVEFDNELAIFAGPSWGGDRWGNGSNLYSLGTDGDGLSGGAVSFHERLRPPGWIIFP